MELNKTYNGFRLIAEDKIGEINSTALVFEHEKSGARLLKLENDDDNKVFSISFRTPPYDSTGLPHILEHSVLCGSEKFPCKEPFVELLKGSLQTFLNAFTFPDKTMYPFASRNEKDFFNLMDVYMNAVFYPNIHNSPYTFMQEGWHYELENPEDALKYKGVVYNEMKGAFSSPESILIRKSMESLFPDTPYGVESGGDPEDIPTLTYENFTEFHKKYYHPCNSFIYLYGDGDILKELSFIDKEYLAGFEKIELDSGIDEQSAFTEQKEVEIDYPISKEDTEEDKTYFSLNYVTGNSYDNETLHGLIILENILLETPASPLKKALIDAELGKDVFGVFESDICQPFLSVVIKNSNQNKKERFVQVVNDTLSELVKTGIDKKLIQAAVNKREFQIREADFQSMPKGLVYSINTMSTWLYGRDPLINLQYENAFKSIREKMEHGFFENLIKNYLLENKHRSLVVLTPEKGLQDKNDEKLKHQLAEYKSTLSQEQIEEIINQTEELKKRQSEPDSKENLETIPALDLDDIDKQAELLPQKEKDNQVKALLHPVFTNGIVYFKMIFDSSSTPAELVPYLGLLENILGKIGTENYDYMDLSKEINIHLGGLGFSAGSYQKYDDDSDYHPTFSINSKVLIEKVPKMVELIREITLRTVFDDRKRIREIIQELKSRVEMSIMNSGHTVAIKRMMSFFSLSGAYNERLSGITFYKFIAGLEKDFDKRIDEVIANLKKVSELVFTKNGMIISITSPEDTYNEIIDDITQLTDSYSCIDSKPETYDFIQKIKSEGLTIPGQVQYVVKGNTFKNSEFRFSGKMKVLQLLVSRDFLWNRLRVKGGAYGAYANFSPSENIYFGSYRDPNLKETLDNYDAIADYLANIQLDERELKKYIIGTIGTLDAPLTPSMKGKKALSNYLAGLSQERIQAERDDILSITDDDIKQFSKLLSETLKDAYICVVGNESKIKENSNLFDQVVNVLTTD